MPHAAADTMAVTRDAEPPRYIILMLRAMPIISAMSPRRHTLSAYAPLCYDFRSDTPDAADTLMFLSPPLR